MRQTWFLWVVAVLIAAPALYADEGPPRRDGEGEGPRHHPEGGEGRRQQMRVFRGVLVELGEKGLALKVGDDVVDVRFPPRVPDPLERFLKQHYLQVGYQ